MHDGDIMTENGRKFPVAVITGFLGSGKTTLLRRLLADPGMAKTAVLINEFGEIGLDHLLVRSVIGDDAVILQNGCICCTLRTDLQQGLRDLIDGRADGKFPEFDRIVIETTGLADPAPDRPDVADRSNVAPPGSSRKHRHDCRRRARHGTASPAPLSRFARPPSLTAWLSRRLTLCHANNCSLSSVSCRASIRLPGSSMFNPIASMLLLC